MLLSRFIQPSQRIQRRQIVRPLIQDDLVCGDGFGLVFQAAFDDLGNAPQQVTTGGAALRQIDAATQDFDQLVPLALLDVQRFQGIQGADFLRVAVQDLAVGRHRRLRVKKQRLLNVTDAEQQLFAVAALGPLGLTTQDFDQLTVLRRLLIQTSQGHSCGLGGIQRRRI